MAKARSSLTMTRLAWAVLLTSAALAGCAGGIDEVDGPPSGDATDSGIVLEDPAGDARQPPLPCHLMVNCQSVSSGESVPAPDLQALRVAVDGPIMHMELDLVTLDAGASQIQRDDGFGQMAHLEVCLQTDGRDACVSTTIAPGATANVESRLHVPDAECNEWQACIHSVATTLVAGTPATLQYQLPVRLLNATAIEAVHATAALQVWEPVLPAAHAAFTLYASDEHKHEHFGPFGFFRQVDELEKAEFHASLAPGSPDAEANATVVLRSAVGTNWGAGSPQDTPGYDLREIHFREVSDHLEIEFILGAFDPAPVENMHIMLEFGAEGSPVYEAGLLREGGETYGYVGHCVTYPCDGPFVPTEAAHNHGGVQQRLGYEAEQAGFSIEVPWDHLPGIHAGAQLNLAVGFAMYSELAVYVGDYGDDVHGDIHKMSMLDTTFGAQPFTFRIGSGDGHAHDHP